MKKASSKYFRKAKPQECNNLLRFTKNSKRTKHSLIIHDRHHHHHRRQHRHRHRCRIDRTAVNQSWRHRKKKSCQTKIKENEKRKKTNEPKSFLHEIWEMISYALLLSKQMALCSPSYVFIHSLAALHCRKREKERQPSFGFECITLSRQPCMNEFAFNFFESQPRFSFLEFMLPYLCMSFSSYIGKQQRAVAARCCAKLCSNRTFS